MLKRVSAQTASFLSAHGRAGKRLYFVITSSPRQMGLGAIGIAKAFGTGSLWATVNIKWLKPFYQAFYWLSSLPGKLFVLVFVIATKPR
mgnify:CR=1 FL=1